MSEVTYYVALPFVLSDDGVAAAEPLSLDEAYLDVTASVSSIDAGRVHDLRIMVAHGFRKSRKKATVLLERVQPSTECPQIARL